MTTTVIDLASLTATQGFVLSGVSSNASLGTSVSGIGDFNDDGIDDLLVSAPNAASSGLNGAGLAYVIFGKSGGMGNLSISSLTAETGVILSGAQSSGGFGISVAAAGDVNGDGKADAIIGAPSVTFNGIMSGGAYVVLDTGSATSMGAKQLTGTAGFAISGVAASDAAGVSVDGIGDINGDGYDDVTIGAYIATRGSRQNTGEAYVVYGSANPTSVNLATLDTAHGFTIMGAASGDYTGFSVSGAGDVNGDGHDDVIVGAFSAKGGPGAAYVLYGGTNLANVDLASLTEERGFKISGGAAGDAAGFSVDSAGDINGDGIADLIVSAPFADANGTDSGALYIVYGQAGARANLSFANLTAAQGLRIAGAPGETAGISIRNVGDLDHDRIDDLFIGSNQADPNGRADAGVGYVLYGGHVNGAVDLAALDPAQGFMVLGAAAGDSLGQSAAGAGDLNDDGIDDLVLGVAGADPGGVNGAGAAYVIYGHASGTLVTKVDAPTADGTYAPGDVITLTLTFESTVVVDTSGGTPRLKLETGATDHYATYVSGSGSNILVFAYTVEAGDQTGDLDFASTRALELNGGSLTSADGKAAVLTLMDPGAAGSLAVNANIQVSPSAPPAIAGLAGDSVAFTEDGPAVALDAGGDATLTTALTDFSGGRLIARLVSGAVADEDRLLLRPDAHVGLQGASVTFDGTSIGTVSGGAGGVPLQIIFTAGATSAQAQAVLHALGYSNVDTAAPDTGTRTIGVTVTDPFGASSPAAEMTVQVIAQNDAPVLTPHTVLLSVVSENRPASLSYADLQAAGTAFDPDGDTLAFKIMSIGAGTVLVDGVAAVAGDTVITAASKVIWTPQDNTTGRMDAFSIAAFDGTAVSDEWATVRAVVTDLDPDLVGPATVSVPRGAAAGTIIATPTVAGDTNGLDFRILEVGVPSGAASWDGSVVLTPVDAGLAISGASGQVYVQDAAKFAAVAGASLVVRIGVDDEDADANLDDTLSISVSLKNPNANEPPTGAPTALLAAGMEDTPYLLSAAALLAGFSDPEGGGLHVRDLRADHGTLADNGDGTFTLTPGPNFNGNLALTYAVADAAGNLLDSQTQSVVIAAANDAPVFTASPNVSVAEQVTIHPLDGLGVTDADDATLASAQVRIADGYVSGEDRLDFFASSATGDITAAFNLNSGRLDLTSASGTATMAEWQAALSAVTYQNTSDAPTTADRTLVFSVTDPLGASTEAQKSLSVIAMNDAPVLSDGTVEAFGEEGKPVLLPIASLAEKASDPDGDPVSYKILIIPAGTVTVDGVVATEGDIISAASKVEWTPPANSTGDFVALSVAAFDGASMSSGSQVFTVSVADANPAFTGPLSVTIAENSPVGTVVAKLAVSGDTDGLTFGFGNSDAVVTTTNDDVVTVVPTRNGFSTGASGSKGASSSNGAETVISPDGAFALDTKTGEITVHDASKLDFETSPKFTLTVTVDDEDADTAPDSMLTLTVDLTDVNEAPHIAATGAVLNITDLGRLPASDVVTLNGAKADETLGISVSKAGDVNGDGIDDFIIGATDTSSTPTGGAAYVMYGKKGGLDSLSPASLTSAQGFKINGAAAGDSLGHSVSNAGDVNGDGIDDLIVGARSADAKAGAAYVIYGKAGGHGAINLDALSAADGFKISSSYANGRLGTSVSAAGDINNDGIDDLIVGAQNASVTATSSGGAFVLYGKKEGLGTIDLAKLSASDGFSIGGSAYDSVGVSVSGLGDVNGDGIDDIIYGAIGSDLNVGNSGAAFVVYGKSGGLGNFTSTAITSSTGFRIIGATAASYTGVSVSDAGDVNGDGIADMIVGGTKAEGGTGAAYVVYGKTGGSSDIQLKSLTADAGFKIVGGAKGDDAGYSVSGAGDVNGDGIDDLLVASVNADANGTNSGAVYVVFGTKAQQGTVNLATLTQAQGFMLAGASSSDGAGFSVSAAGDLNGDGIDDILVGAVNANDDYSGAAYVVYGKKNLALALPPEGKAINLTYTDLLKTATVSDPDGDAVSFKVMALGSGSLVVDGVTAVAGQTVISPTSAVTWTPPANTTGTIEAFSVAAFDGALTSDDPEPVPVRIAIADLDPILTGPTAVTIAENSAVGTVVARLAVAGDQDGLTFGFASSDAVATTTNDDAVTSVPTRNGFSTGASGSKGASFSTGASSSNGAETVISPDGAFALDTKTGVITVHDASKLDFETSPRFTFTVTVDDEDADTTADSTLALTINLDDVNEAPVIAGVPASPLAATTGQKVLLPAFTFTDPDSTVFTVTLTAMNGTLAGLMDRDADTAGVQVMGTAAEIQATLAAATFTPRVDGIAQVIVTVTDNGGAATSATLAFEATTPTGNTVEIDGAVVSTTAQTQADGSIQQTVTLKAVEAGAGGSEAADIPLVQGADETLLSARIPSGVGLTAVGAPAPQGTEASLLELIAQIRLHTADGSDDQTQLAQGGTGFLQGLPSDTSLVVQTLVLTVAEGAALDAPIVIRVPEGTAPTALVVDASALPVGTLIQFENVSFAAVVGPVSLGGGAGAQLVYADDAPQTIMLGADDDELHAGGGNDTVGSAGGNDRIFGEAGDDIVFGGPGRDLLHGGLGTDTARFDGNRADYEILHDRAFTTVRSLTDATDVDVLVNVETIAFADGTVDLALPESIGWIAALYTCVLGRQADMAGIQHYAGLVERGVSAGDIALAFLTSPEAIAAGTGAAASELTVEKLYSTLFGRAPDAEGLAYHKAQLAAGTTLAEVAAHFVLSPEMQGHLPAAAALDFVVGAVSAGMVTGTTGADTLQGGTLDDKLIGHGGVDLIDGRTGDDTAVFSGARGDYAVSTNGLTFTVRSLVESNSVATLVNMEHARFDDTTIDLTANSDLGWIGALYTQVLGRQGEGNGLIAHLADYQAGASKGAIALSFMLSPEAVAAGHGAQDAAHLTADTVYQALLGRAPTQADHAAYGNLETDVAGLADALMGSAEVRGHDALQTAQDFFV